MKNIRFIVLAIIAAFGTSVYAQTTKTYTFDDGVALATDWTVNANVPSGGSGTCTISSPSKFTAKNGNYLYFTFENKSGITITVTSTASYSGISNIKFDAVANDNSKPNFTLNIVDDNGNVVKNIYSNCGTKSDFNTGGTNKWGVSNSAVSPATTGHIQLVLYASSSGKYAAIDNLAVTYSAAPVVSTDATLSALTYNGTSVPGFSASTLSYEVELPAGTTAVPTVAATVNESHASAVVTQASALPGTASVLVTAEDGTTTQTYTITFTVASNKPKVLSATWPNIQGTAVVDNVNMTITGQVKNGTGLTAIEPTFTGNNISSWTPVGAQDFSNGAVEYTFSSQGPVEMYNVTITEAPALSTDATLSALKYGNTSVPGFSASTYVYNIELPSGTTAAPTLQATVNESHATVAYTQASSVPGVGKVDVTAEDGTTKLTYTVNFTVAVPQSSLTTHVPEIYEAKEIAGGYGGSLAVFNSREYEVYYAGKTSDSYMTVDVRPSQKQKGIATTSSATACKAQDGWFEATGNSISNFSFTAIDEFSAGEGCMHKIYNNNAYTFHIQGYDQFSFYAKDNSTTIDPSNASKNKRFQVYIDNVLQPENPSSTASIRRYTISAGEHVIKVVGIGGSNNEFYGWSLRVAQEPRTKYLKGNDSTQVVMQTTAIKPITYATKYNNIPGAQTRLVWLEGHEATGIGMSIVPGSLTDTIMVSGTANCPVGEYKYAVVAYYNGIETSRAIGTFTVKSDIQATSDVTMSVYQGEEMDQITFRYYALDADAVQITWPNTQPTGITGSGSDGKYIIGGTPTVTGTFPFAITVAGADTVINGQIIIQELNYGDNAVLFLYKNNLSYEKDGVYTYLKTANRWNLIPRKQKENGLRPADQYANYQWILISEDVDADNVEVLEIIRGKANLPVLNLKGFAYASDRLGWGEPDNGAVDTAATKNEGRKLYIEQPNHPIYTAKMNYLKAGDSIVILSDYKTKGIMPINVDVPGSYCLGTAYTRDIDNYYGRGERQTALHEIPVTKPEGKKYICLPLAREVTLSSQGQQLMEGIITYLTSPTASVVQLPTLKINRFSVLGVNATIDQDENTIFLSLPQEQYDSLETAQPIIELADPTTHVTPSVEPSIDLRYAVYLPKTFVVSDYINRRGYQLTIELYDPQGIEEVYEAGMWVNVYDIYGRKVTTTNEDVYTMDLPKGIYIIVTESGQTLKIMR